jgi:pilus assembly protein Flp/PilA
MEPRQQAKQNTTKGELDTMFLPKEEGQGLVEYALIIVLVAIVVIVALTALGSNITDVFTNISETLSGA